MSSIPEIARAMENVLSTTAEAIARPTGFVQRRSKLTGPVFAKTTVLGWLTKPDSRLSDLTQVAAAFGVKISPQGFDDRFTPQAAAFLEQLLDAAVGQVIAAEPVTIPMAASPGLLDLSGPQPGQGGRDRASLWHDADQRAGWLDRHRPRAQADQRCSGCHPQNQPTQQTTQHLPTLAGPDQCCLA